MNVQRKETGAKPGIKDIALRASVSSKTVSNYLNGTGNFKISRETASAIQEAMVALNYRIDDAGSQMRRKGPKERFAVFIYGSYHEVIPQKVYAIPHIRDLLAVTAERLLQRTGLQLIVRHVPDVTEGEDWRKVMIDAEVLVVWEVVDQRLIDLAVRRNVPVLQLSGSGVESLHPGLDGVAWDVAEAVRMAVGHLQPTCGGEIVYLSTWNVSSNRGIACNSTGERSLVAFESACKEMGIAGRVVIEAMPTPEDLLAEAELKHGRLAVLGNPGIFMTAKAVIAGNDDIAMGACLGLRQLGRIPGQDVRVIGRQNFLYARYFSPAITTVANDVDMFVEEAVNLISDRINCNDGDARHRCIPATMIVRESG